MLKIITAVVLLICLHPPLHAQQSIGIGTTTPNASAIVDMASNSKGLLIPRLSLTEINAIPNPAAGLQVINTSISQLWINAGTPAVPKWQAVAANSMWSLAGNSGTSFSTNFIGTIDDIPLSFRINNVRAGLLGKQNTRFGYNAGAVSDTLANIVALGDFALGSNNSGSGKNVAIGSFAGAKTTSGAGNSFIGHNAGYENTTGYSNVAIGIAALYNNKTSSNTVAIGDSAMFESGSSATVANTAVGSKALFANIIGIFNTAIGFETLEDNSNGFYNTAVGAYALKANTNGGSNTALGNSAMRWNRTGATNVAIGNSALTHNISGDNNVAIGSYAMRWSEDADLSVAVGDEALSKVDGAVGNTAIGSKTLKATTVGANNSAVGFEALTQNIDGERNTAFGYKALYSLTGANANVAVGNSSLYSNTTFNQVAVGDSALYNTTTGSGNTAIGDNALESNITGQRNIGIGTHADVALSGLTNATVIGATATIASSDAMVFGNSNVTKWAFGLTTTPAGRALAVGSSNLNGNGAYLTNGGTWTNTSDAGKKEDFSTPAGADLLEKIDKLPITRWKYKGTNEYHIGPTAQDFYKAFQLGLDSTSISTIDPGGVALGGIKQLIKENKKMEEKIKQLEQLVTDFIKNKLPETEKQEGKSF